MTTRKLAGRPRRVCSHCDFVHYDNPVPGVGVIVEMENGVVLVKRRYEPRAGWWCLPAGFLEADESAAEGAVRRACQRGCRHLWIDTAKSNPPAQAFYRSLGVEEGDVAPLQIG